MRSRHVVPQDHSHVVLHPVDPRRSAKHGTDRFGRPSRTLTIYIEFKNLSQQNGM